jgi:predicted acyltransferase
VAKAFGVSILVLTVATFASYPNHIFSFQNQISGLLQRLAICHLVCSVIRYWLPRMARISVGAATLIGYWFILDAIPVPGSDSSDFIFESNLAAWVDERFLPGNAYFGRWKPDGILTTFPAIGTCLIGALLGDLIRSHCSAHTKILVLIVGGLISLGVGFLAETEMPINRSLWTPTYVLVSAGYCSILLAVFYFILQIAQKKQWCFPLLILGRNFFLTIVILDLTPIGTAIAGRVGDRMSPFCPDFAPFAQAAFEILSNWLILFWLCHFEDFFEHYQELKRPQLLQET